MAAHGPGWLLCLLLLCLRAGAQGPTTATVRGDVRDAAGRPVAGAAVRLRASPSGDMRIVVTDRHGHFGLLGLVGGRYVASVRLPLVPLWAGSALLEVEPGEEADVELRTSPGGLSLRREDVAADSAEDTQLSEVAERLGRPSSRRGNVQAVAAEPLATLPVPERAWEAVAEVSSAVHDSTLIGMDEGEEDPASAREERQAGATGAALSADGLPVTGEAPEVDGLTDRQSFRGGGRGVSVGGPRAASAFTQAGVRSLRFADRRYSAASGIGARGVLSVATRGAGIRDGWHGSAFAQAKDARWAAVNPFSVVTAYQNGATQTALARPADTLWQFGAAVGGSVQPPGLAQRWRLAVYGAAEGRLRRRVLFSSPEKANFFGLTTVQRALLGNRGVRSAQIAPALEYLSGLTGPQTLHGTQWLGFARVDATPDRADRFAVDWRSVRAASPVTAGAQVADGVTSRALADVGWGTIGVNTGTVRWAHAPGPHWVNEVAVQLSRDIEAERPGPGSAAVPGVGPGGFAPQVSLGPHGFTYGTPASLGRVAYPDERRVEVAENLAWQVGRHLLTVGGNWSRVDDRVASATNLEGSFLYDSGNTGGRAGGLVDWITDYTFGVHAYPNGGCPSINAAVHYSCFRSYSQSFMNAEVEFVTHEIAGYAEDALRLGPRLRVSVGARWEYQLLPFPLTPNTALDRTLAAASAADAAGWGTTTSFPEDRNNLGPRASVRWSPGGRGRPWLMLEAGYGMYFGRLPGATLRAALTETGLPQTTTRIRITPKTEVACPQVANQGFGFLCAFPYAPVGVAAVQQTSASVVFAQRFRLPAVQRASLGVEREVGTHALLRLRYATAWATQLPQTTDLNIAPATESVSYMIQGGDGRRGLWTGQSFRVPLYTARRSAKYGPVTAIVSNANATYHSGTAELLLRGWHGWGGRAGVTFSRALDYEPLQGPTPRQDGQFDPFSDGYDKGRSSLDRPWQAAGVLSYRSDGLAGGGEWRRRVLGGWTMAALGRAGSGAPYSYGIFGGTRLPGGHESINGSGGATYLPTVGRNTLRLPPISKLDLRTAREMNFGGLAGRAYRVALHADAFNLLNSVSFSRVQTRAFLRGVGGSVGGMTPLVFQDGAAVAAEGLTVPAFGTPLSSTSGVSRERTLEFGMLLSF